MSGNATTRSIWNGGYGGGIQLLRSDADDNRWAKIGIVDNTGGFVKGITILDSGNVGIGTEAPEQKLHVSAASNQIRIQDSGSSKKFDLNVDGTAFFIDDMTAGVNRVAIDTSGKVGIGTTAPNGSLDVAATGDATNPTIQVGYATSSRANYRFGLYSDSEAGYLSNKNGNNGIRFVHRGGTVMQVGYGGDTSTPYVGIGTTAPTDPLQIVKTVAGAELSLIHI